MLSSHLYTAKKGKGYRHKSNKSIMTSDYIATSNKSNLHNQDLDQILTTNDKKRTARGGSKSKASNS